MKLWELIRKWMWEPTGNTLIQFFRSLWVGAIATVVDMGIMAVFFSVVGLNELLAAAFGFIGGLLTNYFISTFWVFNSSKFADRKKEFGAFTVIAVIGLGLTELIIWIFGTPLFNAGLLGTLAQPTYVYIGKMAAVVLVFIWNFASRKILIYG